MRDGLLIIDKPEGITSHDVVSKARKILQTKKIGHTGTLDPMATGVLVLCVGAATKLVQYLTCDEKIYEVEMKLGIRTDTGDITGQIIEQIESVEKDDFSYVSSEFWKSFIGKQKQVPPMYSAIKKDGVKLYELARKGIEIEREPRDIEIFDIFDVIIDKNMIKFTVHCSKGTYIRVLCEDIAKKLGTIGTMTSLRRIKTGKFSIGDSCGIDEIDDDSIISMEKIYDKNVYIKKDIEKLLNGMSLKCEMENGLCNLYYNNKYIGIGEICDNYLKRKIIVENNMHLV